MRLILDRGVLSAMRRDFRESEADLMRARLVAAAETLELLAPYEDAIRAMIARGSAAA